MAIDPRGADLKRYLQEDHDGPVVMLNLLRFAEGGRELYDQYARALSNRESFFTVSTSGKRAIRPSGRKSLSGS